MRPWTLVQEYSTRHVPFITSLKMPPQVDKRCSRKTKASELPSFAHGWQWYIRGNIVSLHQQRIIVSFMSINRGKSTTDAELDASMAAEGHSGNTVLEYDNDQTTAFVRKLLVHMYGAMHQGGP